MFGIRYLGFANNRQQIFFFDRFYPSLTDLRALPDIPRVLAPQTGEGRQDATGEALFAAVDARPPFQTPKIILRQEFLAQCGAEMFPGEDFVYWSLTVGIEGSVKPHGIEGIHPGLVIEVLTPGIELCPVLPSLENHLGHAAIAA